MSNPPSGQANGRTPATDEVQRRVGRNLIIFQQVEAVLKFLTTHARFHGPVSELNERLAMHAESIQRKPMGELAGRLNDIVMQQGDADIGATPDSIDEAWLGFRFTVETDQQVAARHESEMRELVERRNDLVHHFLPRWNTAVAGDTDEALAYLDAQREAAVAMLERLQGWSRSMHAAQIEFASFLASDEGQQQFELMRLRSSRLVLMLGEIALKTPRKDGWTLLSTAGHLIKRDAPDELDGLRERFGHGSLKAILVATGLFDVQEEPTGSAGTRTIYRINERWSLEPANGAANAVAVQSSIRLTDQEASKPTRFN